LVFFLIPLQFVNLLCNLSKCILLFFSYISSLLLLFSWHYVFWWQWITIILMKPHVSSARLADVRSTTKPSARGSLLQLESTEC
jgi:hypothetical protein